MGPGKLEKALDVIRLLPGGLTRVLFGVGGKVS